MILAYLALLGRIVLLGCERIAVKKLGEESDSVGAAFLLFVVASLFLFPFIFFAEAPENFKFVIYVALSSAIYAVAFALYVKSLSEGEASLVSPLYNFNVFFLLIITAIFLGESITIFKIVGLILLVYGASFLNKQKNIFTSLRSLIKNKACLYMIIASLFIAFGRTIDGFVVKTLVSPLIYAFSSAFGVSLCLFIYIVSTKKLNTVKPILKNKKKIAVTAGFLNSYSFLFLLFALTKLDVSIAEPASMLGMIITVILAHFIFKKKIRDRLLGVVIMIVGAWLLFV